MFELAVGKECDGRHRRVEPSFFGAFCRSTGAGARPISVRNHATLAAAYRRLAAAARGDEKKTKKKTLDGAVSGGCARARARAPGYALFELVDATGDVRALAQLCVTRASGGGQRCFFGRRCFESR